jgi:hypothetical protein
LISRLHKEVQVAAVPVGVARVEVDRAQWAAALPVAAAPLEAVPAQWVAAVLVGVATAAPVEGVQE